MNKIERMIIKNQMFIMELFIGHTPEFIAIDKVNELRKILDKPECSHCKHYFDYDGVCTNANSKHTAEFVCDEFECDFFEKGDN